MSRALTVEIIDRPRTRKDRRRFVALSMAAVAITPLILFAAVWASLLLVLGGIWVANALGFI